VPAYEGRLELTWTTSTCRCSRMRTGPTSGSRRLTNRLPSSPPADTTTVGETARDELATTCSYKATHSIPCAASRPARVRERVRRPVKLAYLDPLIVSQPSAPGCVVLGKGLAGVERRIEISQLHLAEYRSRTRAEPRAAQGMSRRLVWQLSPARLLPVSPTVVVPAGGETSARDSQSADPLVGPSSCAAATGACSSMSAPGDPRTRAPTSEGSRRLASNVVGSLGQMFSTDRAPT